MRHTLIVFLLFFSIHTFALDKGWFYNEQEAKTYANENKVPILLVFAGSDWCRPCMALKNTILTSEPFLKYQFSRMAVLYLDFPMQSKNKLSKELTSQNEKLAAKYNQSGFFPNVIMIDTEGKIKGSIKFSNQTPESFIESCESIINQ